MLHAMRVIVQQRRQLASCPLMHSLLAGGAVPCRERAQPGATGAIQGAGL